MNNGESSLPSLASQAAEISNIEQTVGLIWKELLQLPAPPDPDANFFDLGGDSMIMTMLDYRLSEAFTSNAGPGAVLRAPTLRQLSKLIASS